MESRQEQSWENFCNSIFEEQFFLNLARDMNGTTEDEENDILTAISNGLNDDQCGKEISSGLVNSKIVVLRQA